MDLRFGDDPLSFLATPGMTPKAGLCRNQIELWRANPAKCGAGLWFTTPSAW
jgi:hypothetical protein